jgi:voltage-gated potassium channel
MAVQGRSLLCWRASFALHKKSKEAAMSYPPVEDAVRPRPERHPLGRPPAGWRLSLYRVVFESDTRAGRAFDLILIALILISVGVVMLDSVHDVHVRWGKTFEALEWFFTAVFTLEYLARLACVQHPRRYAFSFLGIVDLLAVLPTYLAFFFPELHALIDVRVLRMLRIFRILKLGAYVAEFGELGRAIMATRRKIAVFLSFVLIVVVILATLMYLIEGPENGFTSIPLAIYWAITTITTVGFGDITPQTDFGRFITSLMMLMGWGTLAVPTGIVSAEFAARRVVPGIAGRICGECLHVNQPESKYCGECGARL